MPVLNSINPAFDEVNKFLAMRDQLANGPGFAPTGLNQGQNLATTPNSLGMNLGGNQGISGLSPAEQWIIQRESGGRTTADNPHSTAFGLGQLLESNRRKYLGANYNTTNPALQLNAFRNYVRDRYGTAQQAQQFWQSRGWY